MFGQSGGLGEWSSPALALSPALVAVSRTLAFEFPVTLRLLARGAFHGGVTAYSVMNAITAVGGVAGGLMTAARSWHVHASSLRVAAAGWGAAILAAALVPTLPLELVLLAVVGYGTITFNSLAKAPLQLGSDPPMHGRVLAMWTPARNGSIAVGGPPAGWIPKERGSR